jgi:hypothetical protein
MTNAPPPVAPVVVAPPGAETQRIPGGSDLPPPTHNTNPPRKP